MRKGGELSKLLPHKHRTYELPAGVCEGPRCTDPKLRISMTQGINRIFKKEICEHPLSIV